MFVSFSHDDITPEADGMAAHLALFAPDVETEDTLADDFDRYLAARPLKDRTIAEYRTTLSKLLAWRAKVHRSPTPMQFRDLDEETLTQFLVWCRDQATLAGASNPGRVANKSREHLSAWLRWGFDQRELSAIPRLPDEFEQVTAAGNFFLEDAEVDALYWATYALKPPRNWKSSLPIGAYWRCALTFFYNLGLDTHTIFPKSGESTEQVLRRSDVYLCDRSPSRTIRIADHVQPHVAGWLFVQRQKTSKCFERPLNRVMFEHVTQLLADDPDKDSFLFCSHGVSSGGCRPNDRFHWLVDKAKIEPRIDLRTKQRHKWDLKHLRKTSGSAHEVAAISGGADVLGHSDAKVTHGNYVNAATAVANRIPLMAQPRSFTSIYDDSVRPPHDLLFAK